MKTEKIAAVGESCDFTVKQQEGQLAKNIFFLAKKILERAVTSVTTNVFGSSIRVISYFFN
jgi:hypothetical protein